MYAREHKQRDLLSADDRTNPSGSQSGADLSRAIWDEMRTQASKQRRSNERGGAAGDTPSSLVSGSAEPPARAAEQASEPAIDRRSEAIPQQPSERTADAASEGGSDQPSDRTPDRPAERQAEPGDTRFLTHPDFHGEIIRRDVEPIRHVYHRGETLERIAADHLGRGASRQDIHRHVEEIERLNDISDQRRIPDGTVLILPGHDTHGAYITRDADGNTHTIWPDGVQRHVAPGGTPGRVYRPAADGSYTDHHWGPAGSGENYDIARTADGQYLINGTDRLAALEQQLRQNPEQNREELRRLEHIRQSLREFDERARREGLSLDEVGRTHFQVVRLLDTEADARGPDRTQRFRLADEIMSHAARPTEINQGEHSTCGVAATEVMMYSRHPAEAARLVTDIALTNRYETTSGGTEVRIGSNLRRPRILRDGEVETPSDRDYASQIFQVTAVNVHYARHGLAVEGGHLPPGEVVYTQSPFRMAGLAGDTGERLIDGNGNAILDRQGHPVRSPMLHDDAVSEIMNAISGSDPPETLLASADRGLDDQGRALAGYRNNRRFGSERELRQQLEELSENGHLPAPITVYSGHQPFFNDSGGGAAGGSGGWHLVNVTGYDPATGRVEIDNQWGQQSDHQGDRALTVHELYLATQPPGDPEVIADLQRRERRERDPEAQLQVSMDLLREQHAARSISPADYNQQLAAAINEYGAGVIQHPAQTSAEEQQAILPVIISQIANLSPADRAQVLSRIEGERIRNFYSTRVQALLHARACLSQGRSVEQCRAETTAIALGESPQQAG